MSNFYKVASVLGLIAFVSLVGFLLGFEVGKAPKPARDNCYNICIPE